MRGRTFNGALRRLAISGAPWMIAAIVCLQAMQFTEGYRRTADEVAFVDLLLQGWDKLLATTEAVAVSQGRIGHYFSIPLNTVGALFAGEPAARAAFVMMHFAVLGLFAFYFSRVSSCDVTRTLLLILVTFQPVCRVQEYMPPVSYPLQNSLPFLLLLVARLVLLSEWRRGDGGRRYFLWPAHGLFALGLAANEYAFLFGTSLLAVEYGFRLLDLKRRPIVAATELLAQPSFRIDVISIGLVSAVYFGYRWLHPSSYVGNVLDAAFDLPRVAATMWRHVLAGTILSRDISDLAALPLNIGVAATVVGGATAYAFTLSLKEIRSIRAPYLLATAALMLIVYVTFPLAGNARQQYWCLESGACGYLDSRVAYFGVAVTLVCLIASLLQTGRTLRTPQARIVAIAVVLGTVGGVTFARNWQEAMVMRRDAAVWQRAALLACHPDLQPEPIEFLVRAIDPEQRVPFHPNGDRSGTWRRYIAHVADTRACAAPSETRQAALEVARESLPQISAERPAVFSTHTGGKFLKSGWSRPEPQGVWSDGERADLVMLLPVASPSVAVDLNFHLTPYFGPSVQRQRIDVYVNESLVEQWELTEREDGNRWSDRSISIPAHMLRDGVTMISFRISMPRNPALEPNSLDRRHLGIWLRRITLKESATR